jgi:hypothetical protein
VLLLDIMRNEREKLIVTKEKKTFAWDTILTMSTTEDKLTVRGTDIEVVWCPATLMYWEI